VHCETIYKNYDDPAELDRALVVLGEREDRHGHWEGVDVLDLKDGFVGEGGDVTLCAGGEVSTVIGSFGCNLQAPQIQDSACPSVAPVHARVIVISQMWGNGYFHALIEGLPRLVAAFHYMGKGAGLSWEVHSMLGGPLAGQVAQFMGVKGFISGSVLAKQLLLPAPTQCGGSVRGVNTARLRDLIRSKFDLSGMQPQRHTLVLIKRVGGRSLANHDKVLALCRSLWQGVVVEHTGDGTFEEQMRVFYSAAVVIGPHGAGFSNAIAMGAGTTILEVLPETGSNRLNVCYATLAFTLGIQYYALGAPGFDSDGTGTVDLAALRQHPIWFRTG
jgi:hypothetical protein